VIISHKYRFIFIKTYKTAGTSIEVFLSQHCGPKDVLTPIIPHVEPHQARNYESRWNPCWELLTTIHPRKHVLLDWWLRQRFYNHIPAELVFARLSPNIWNSYFKFCVERNPWDKALSYYHMVKHRSGGTLTFDEFLTTGDYSPNYPLYTDNDGQLMVDRVLKYENLMTELGEVFEKLGIPFTGDLGVNAKSEYRTDRRDYRDVYTVEQRHIVESIFAKEIELHGYTF
jgi:hypothetical protein